MIFYADEFTPILRVVFFTSSCTPKHPTQYVDDYSFQTHPKDKHSWTAISQLTGPPGALWKAGHESVTWRNPLGLWLLETTCLDGLVFNYGPAPPSLEGKNPSDEIQPDGLRTQGDHGQGRRQRTDAGQESGPHYAQPRTRERPSSASGR